MNQTTQELIAAKFEQVNALERRRREKYFFYHCERGDDTDTLETYMAKYASIARVGVPASPASITALRSMSGPALPQGGLKSQVQHD